MRTEDFDFELDKSLIAQTPLKDRSASRLMILDRKTGEVSHDSFKNIVNYLNENDVLVLNDTKVLPARLLGEKADTHAHIELMLLHVIEGNEWECLVKPLRRIHLGTIITFGEGLLKAKVIKILEDGIIRVEFLYEGIFYEILDKLGTMPLPPYIKEKLDDPDRYQTVYAKEIGSVAAPTAGLHFTKAILEQAKAKGVKLAYITLHVGLGTFRPVKVDDVTKHKMHTERYYMSQATADILKNATGRIIAVGTTSTRTLESIMHKYGEYRACSGSTDIFIYPGFEFMAIDALITNFHLPKSTLVMLVSAFSKKEYILNAYAIANKERYRFFSFGDCMLIK